MEREYPELLEEMMGVVREVLKTKVEPQQANAMAREVVEAIRKHYGGQQLYVPQGASYYHSEEAQQIYREFDGSVASLNELARKYGKSTIHLRRIIKAVRAHNRNKGQLSILDSIQPNNNPS